MVFKVWHFSTNDSCMHSPVFTL